MSEPSWRDMIVGDRMRVDQEFTERVRQSGFSNQEWSLIMTAVNLEIEGSGDEATLVADTSRLPAIMPELEKISRQMGSPGGGSAPGSRGIFDTLKESLGFGNGTDDQRVKEAERLASAYAGRLEKHLRDTGRWRQIQKLG